MEVLMQPLLHIGYHKTGSTWLQQKVFSNPEAGFRRIAGPESLRPTFIEINPFGFNPDIVRKHFKPKIREAQDEQLVPVLSNERLSGSPYAGGYDGGLIADRLAAVFPDARVLVVIRKQSSLLMSIYKAYVRKGGAASFEQFVSPLTGTTRMPSFRFDFLEYHRLIGYYMDLFGSGNVLALPYELLNTQPEAFLEHIGEFAGVAATAKNLRSMNVSHSALALLLKRHANRLIVKDGLNQAPPFAFEGSRELVWRLCRKVDKKIPVSLRDRYERRLLRFAEEQAGNRYAESNALTSKLTGYDLRAFGYPCEPSPQHERHMPLLLERDTAAGSS
jgi:hypothetical protein